MSLSSGSIKRPVAVAMLFFAIALLGVISFQRLPIDLLPDISYPRLVVYTSYPDVAPREVERFVTERIEHRRRIVEHQDHVRIVDRSPTGDRGAVEHLTAFEKAFVDNMRGHRDVLFFAACVGKSQVDEFDVFFFYQFENVRRRHGLPPLTFRCR